MITTNEVTGNDSDMRPHDPGLSRVAVAESVGPVYGFLAYGGIS